ncbi:MAG: hypothetical protein EHM45_17040 [Desulfobacteraceae bacterium]|nr:MAG: hypothetical protein EHM45_17040 [Desulfobacteraceae bacterium]
MEKKDPKLKEIWNQKEFPVVFRKGKGEPLLVRFSDSDEEKAWLKDEHRNKPKWLKNYKCWKIPKAWFEDVVKRALIRYKGVYVIQPFRPQEKCAPACWNATGIECDCSCMGENHGSGNPIGKWYIVSEALGCPMGRKTICV